MDVRHLRYALAVAEERSFTRAAERLYISQPGLSRAIRDLEAELGLELFDRSGRELRLIGDGIQVMAHARVAVDTFDDAAREIHGLVGTLRGSLRLGVSVDTWPHLGDVLGRLRARHPDLQLELRAGSDRSLSASVDRGELDAAIVWWPEVDVDWTARVLLDVPTLVAVPVGSSLDRRLADPDRSPGDDVADILHGSTVMLFDRSLGPATYDGLLEVLAPLGDVAVEPVSVMEAGIESAQLGMLHGAIARGAVTICTPAHFARVGDARLAAHAGLVGDAQISIVHNRRAAGLARAVAADLAVARVGTTGE